MVKWCIRRPLHWNTIANDTIAVDLLKNTKNKKKECQIVIYIFTSRGAHVNCAVNTHLIGNHLYVEHDGGV